MFSRSEKFNKSLNNLDTSEVTNIESMFSGANQMKEENKTSFN